MASSRPRDSRRSVDEEAIVRHLARAVGSPRGAAVGARARGAERRGCRGTHVGLQHDHHDGHAHGDDDDHGAGDDAGNDAEHGHAALERIGKTETTPEKETAPAKASSTPTTSTEKASTLPFTGFDLRWDIGFGLLLMGAGFSIVVAQRRQRRQHGR